MPATPETPTPGTTTPEQAYDRAYMYALGALDASDVRLGGMDDERDAARFATAYRDHFRRNPVFTPGVRAAFGEWRATEGIAPQEG